MPPSEAAPGDRLIAVGVFGAAQGVRGEVRLKSYTADPAGIGDLGALADTQGRERWVLTALRRLRDDMLVVKVAGIADRTAAEALTGHELFVPRSRLPEAAADEFYHVDLIGLRAETEAGEVVGVVKAVENWGAGDILEIATGAGASVLVPFTRPFVPHVDFAARRLVVVLPEEGPDEDAAASAP